MLHSGATEIVGDKFGGRSAVRRMSRYRGDAGDSQERLE
jgi:hypothetical protein